MCDEFFSLPIFPQYPITPCDSTNSGNCTCNYTLLEASPVTNCTNLL